MCKMLVISKILVVSRRALFIQYDIFFSQYRLNTLMIYVITVGDDYLLQTLWWMKTL